MIESNNLIIRRDDNLVFRADCLNVLNQLEERIKNCFERIKDYNFYMNNVIEIEEEFTKIITVLTLVESIVYSNSLSNNLDILNYSGELKSSFEEKKIEVRNPSFVNPKREPFVKKILPIFICGCIFYFFLLLFI
jgi:hypothetical protein